MTHDRPAPELSSNGRDPQGFRPASRRRARIAGGAALAALAIGGNVLVYSSLDQTTDVLQVVTNVRAGERIEASDVRTVSVDIDDNVPAVPADRIGTVVGQYARTYIASGSLVVAQVLQPTPLVTPGTSIVSIEVRPTAVPSGLRERSRVELVVDNGDDVPPTVVGGRVVARPGDEASSQGDVALSVEVAAADAASVVIADEVFVVLLDPGVDPATDDGADLPPDPIDPAAPETGATEATG